MRLKIFAFFAAFFLLLTPHLAFARTNITEWYIKNFETEIVVNSDSTLTITENITADCGNLPGKHGIFRVLSTRNYKTKDTPIIRPIELISITDFNGNPYKYTTTNNSTDHIVTWKIGDSNHTVTGVNNYKIVYKISNAIIFDDPKFDEFYWNINGAFWDMEIDQFTAKVIFPAGVNKSNTEIYNYTGESGSKDNSLVKSEWTGENTLTYTATRGLAKKEGITTSVTFPKNIFTPPTTIPTPADEMPQTSFSNFGSWWVGLIGSWLIIGSLLAILLPIIIFIICFYYWNKYGRDPALNKTIIAQYEPPAKLNPMQLGFLSTHGQLSSTAITASIINLAVKKFLTIKETESKFLFFKNKDYILTLNPDRPTEMSLAASERLLLDYLFEGKTEVSLSSLNNKFYRRINDLSKQVQTEMVEQKIFEIYGFQIKNKMYIALVVVFILCFIMPTLFFGAIISVIIIAVFSSWMSKLTSQGAEYKWQTAGFKLFMQTAEKYRQAFNEKENIFEKFLPYAIVFNIVKQWAGKMAEIYGKDWESRYTPIWYTSLSGSAFNISDFSNSITSLSSSMASTISSSPSSSGSGGGGFSGGGGGGGGGGGW